MNTLKSMVTTLKHELQPALLITKREVRDQFRDWRVIFPIVGLTAFSPFLMNLTVQQIINFVQKYGATLVADRMVPFLLMIVGFFPISVSLVISLDTFVGEKERGSIEPLLDSPLKDWQLYLGKLLASTIPPVVGSYLGMIVYIVGLLFRDINMPDMWVIIIIFVLTTIQGLMMVSGAVVVSSQATSVRAANLLASFIIIPSALLMQIESLVMFWGSSINILWWFILGLLILSFLLIRIGLSHFKREELLGREIDVLNIKWILQSFWQSFTGKAKSFWKWYQIEIISTIKQMKISIPITMFLILTGFTIGWFLLNQFPIPINMPTIDEFNKNIEFLINTDFLSGGFTLKVLFQNLRVVAMIGLLGFLTFGIAGTFPLLFTTAVIGYLFNLLTVNGLPAAYLCALLLPHGIFEIPAIFLSTAAILHASAYIVAPVENKTVGEVWIEAVAFWLKITLGISFPLLFLASIVEIFITPKIVLFFF